MSDNILLYCQSCGWSLTGVCVHPSQCPECKRPGVEFVSWDNHENFRVEAFLDRLKENAPYRAQSK